MVLWPVLLSSHIFAGLDHPIGARDTDQDVILRCLSAQETYFDPESGNATYVWSLKQKIGNGRWEHLNIFFW